ncbi:MAG: thioredoxin family protein [Chloroflexi bacterium]|nr:thioredoxin family protein [Chloroflexota bacterium]
MTRNQERHNANEQGVTLGEKELAPFKGLPKPVNVLMLAEDWCGDVIANTPIIGRLASEVDTLNLRVFLRDQNTDIMDAYLNQGKYKSIPTVVFFDEGFNELGRWVERPASVTKLREEKRQAIYRDNPEFGSPDAPVDQLPEDARIRLTQAIAAMREETKPWADQEVVREIGALVAGFAAKAS